MKKTLAIISVFVILLTAVALPTGVLAETEEVTEKVSTTEKEQNTEVKEQQTTVPTKSTEEINKKEETKSTEATEKSVDKKTDEKAKTSAEADEKITIKGKVIWKDNNDAEGRRLDEVYVNLRVEGDVNRVDYRIATNDNNWEYEFKDLPKYKYNGSVEIKYTISTYPMNDYSSSQSGNDLICTFSPFRVDRKVQVIWDDNNDQDGIRPSNVELQLYTLIRESYLFVDVGSPVKITENGKWKYTWEGLYAYNKGDWEAAHYNVKSMNTPMGYTVEIEDYAEAIEVTYTHKPTKPTDPTDPTDPTKIVDPTNPTGKGKSTKLPKTGQEKSITVLVLGLGFLAIGSRIYLKADKDVE